MAPSCVAQSENIPTTPNESAVRLIIDDVIINTEPRCCRDHGSLDLHVTCSFLVFRVLPTFFFSASKQLDRFDDISFDFQRSCVVLNSTANGIFLDHTNWQLATRSITRAPAWQSDLLKCTQRCSDCHVTNPPPAGGAVALSTATPNALVPMLYKRVWSRLSHDVDTRTIQEQQNYDFASLNSDTTDLGPDLFDPCVVLSLPEFHSKTVQIHSPKPQLFFKMQSFVSNSRSGVLKSD